MKTVIYALGGIAGVAALTTLLVKALYGTSIGHAILDSIPEGAWVSAHSALGIDAMSGVEDRQDADALAVSIVCLIMSSALTILLLFTATRLRRKRARAASPLGKTST